MKLQVLVAALQQNPEKLIHRMQLDCDAVIVNQCDQDRTQNLSLNQHSIRVYHCTGRGVGANRNAALEHTDADTDIILFSDEDIVYDKGFADQICQAFEQHQKADMLLFNMRVSPKRATYYIQKESRVRWYNSGRYPTYSFAVRLPILRQSGIRFSTLFGGGAKYSNGEDSLFLRDCLRKHFRVYALPIEIGEETERESTWFQGYTEKFFFDRGVLYHYLYRNMATFFAWVFILRKKRVMCRDIKASKALHLMKEGIREGRL